MSIVSKCRARFSLVWLPDARGLRGARGDWRPTKMLLALVLSSLVGAGACGSSATGGPDGGHATGGADAAAGTGGGTGKDSGGAPGSGGTQSAGGRGGVSTSGGATGAGGGTGSGGVNGSGGSSGIGGRGGAAGGDTGSGGVNGSGGSSGIGGRGGAAGGGPGGDGGRGQGGGGASPGGPCTIAGDPSVPCTTGLVASGSYDFFCGLKAGAMRCWGNANAAYFVTTLAPVVARAPPDLVQIAVSDSIASDDPVFCGVDVRGRATCWGPSTMMDLGTGLRAAVLSRYGVCQLRDTGVATCSSIFTTLPSGHDYVQLAISADMVMGLDDTGAVVDPSLAFPAGVYTQVALDGGLHGAVRGDGAILYGRAAPVTVLPGSFVELGIAFSHVGCGLDRAGEVACFAADSQATTIPTPPSGPFVHIAAGSTTFCGTGRAGTTTCWGESAVDVPAAW